MLVDKPVAVVVAAVVVAKSGSRVVAHSIEVVAVVTLVVLAPVDTVVVVAQEFGIEVGLNHQTHPCFQMRTNQE